MELKVWVDGIQRVVCGANLTTTCQDVVVALAHAMGRTGRFTLIEKWQDSERPLTPGECPLQSLHKWGEYAAEVRFYLMQADQEKPAKKPAKQQSVQPSEMEVGFSHNFTPPPSSSKPSHTACHLIQPGNNDSIKRSSTFSGAHNTNYSSVPLSSSLHSKLDHLRLQKQQPQPQQSLTYPDDRSQHHLHPQQQQPQQQQHHQSFPNQNSSQASNIVPYWALPATQQHQNNLTTNVSQNSRNQTSSGGRIHQDQRDHHQKSLAIPAPHHQTKSLPHLHRVNGHLSGTHSSASSNNSSPRDIFGVDDTTSHHSLSPGCVHDISSSPGQDSRLLHPANIPRPSETYSNYPNPKGINASLPHSVAKQKDDPVVQGRTQQQQRQPHPPDQHKRLKTPDASPRSAPKPAPRSQHSRPLSPSSQPYENLPLRRGSQSQYADPSSLSSSSSFREHHSPRDPHSPSRQRDQSRDCSVIKSNVNAQHSDHVEEQRNKSISDQFYPANNRINMPPMPNDAKHPSNAYLGRYNPSGMNGGVHSDEVDTSRSIYSKELPSSMAKTVPYPPQSSQTLPNHSRSSVDMARTTAGSSTNRSQTLPSNSAVQSERPRRSDSKVNFVESALLKQQRSSTDNKNIRTSDPSFTNNNNRHGDINSDRMATGYDQPSVQSIPSKHSVGANKYTSSSDFSTGQESMPESSYPSSFPCRSSSGLAPNYIQQTLPHSNQSSSSSSAEYHHQNYPQHHRHHHHPNQQHTSAFKVVSPRSPNRPNPTLSSVPISSSTGAPVAYNLENQNFDFPVDLVHPTTTFIDSSLPSDLQPHSRQASLEIEEYDLDQNFPDFDHQSSSTLPRVTSRKILEGKMGHTEYVMDRPKSSSMEPEYMRILRQVKMQLERLKMVGSQVNEMDAEILSLETEQSNLDLKLDAVSAELVTLEKMEEKNQSELDDLDRVEWVNVLDGETKCEQDLTSQMSKLRIELADMEIKLGETSKEEAKTEAELQQEKKMLEDEEKEEELKVNEANENITATKNELSEVEKGISQREQELKELESSIAEVHIKIKSRAEEVDKLEKLLKNENLKGFQANPVPKEGRPSSVSESAVSTDTLAVPPEKIRPSSDSGEAILKILEGRLSPRTPPSPTVNDSDNGTKTVMQHHPYISQTAVKNPNGVWV